MWDRKELKARGKAAFKANYWKSVLVAFLLIAFVIGTGSSSGRAAGSKLDEQNLSFTAENGVYEVNGQSYDNLQDAVTALGEAADANPEDIQEVNNLIEQVQNDPETAKALMMAAALIGGALLFIVLICGLLRILVINPLEVGCRSFFVRNAEAPAALGELGRGFSPYGRSVGTMFLRGLFQFLWSLLFVIPGIIKHYSYRMVPYILADQPELSGAAAITRSREMMNGQKWNAFVLDLSFLGWHILSALTLGILGVFYVNPYQAATNAELYHELKAMQ